ncbi:MAG: flagellar basal body P-ring formation protein FlgA [Pseudomonadales bacterium]|nr:flagellar basal body P-ring formation protein FlgA [Pseudomonadales bacterium]
MSYTPQLELALKNLLLVIYSFCISFSICLCAVAAGEQPAFTRAVATNPSLTKPAFIKERVLFNVQQYVESLVHDAYPDASRTAVKVHAPDARLTLDDCLTAAISLQGNQQLRNRILARLQCSPSKALHLTVEVEVFKTVVVAATALRRQTLLNTNDLLLQEVDILRNSRVIFFDPAKVSGNRLKRALRAGAIITAGMLSKPALINKGDSVVITAKKGAIVVRQPGTAMESGTLGDQIKVKNKTSGRIIKGWVRGPGEIYVPV